MYTFEKVPARCRVNKWHCGTNGRRQVSGQEGKTKLFVTKWNIHSLSLALTLAPTLTLTVTLSLTSDNQMSIAQTQACAVDYHSTHAQSTYLWCTKASVTTATDLEFGSTRDLHDVCDVYPAPSTNLWKMSRRDAAKLSQNNFQHRLIPPGKNNMASTLPLCFLRLC